MGYTIHTVIWNGDLKVVVGCSLSPAVSLWCELWCLSVSWGPVCGAHPDTSLPHLSTDPTSATQHNTIENTFMQPLVQFNIFIQKVSYVRLALDTGLKQIEVLLNVSITRSYNIVLASLVSLSAVCSCLWQDSVNSRSFFSSSSLIDSSSVCLSSSSICSLQTSCRWLSTLFSCNDRVSLMSSSSRECWALSSSAHCISLERGSTV